VTTLQITGDLSNVLAFGSFPGPISYTFTAFDVANYATIEFRSDSSVARLHISCVAAPDTSIYTPTATNTPTTAPTSIATATSVVDAEPILTAVAEEMVAVVILAAADSGFSSLCWR
jgi:hypothetical protein